MAAGESPVQDRCRGAHVYGCAQGSHEPIEGQSGSVQSSRMQRLESFFAHNNSSIGGLNLAGSSTFWPSRQGELSLEMDANNQNDAGQNSLGDADPSIFGDNGPSLAHPSTTWMESLKDFSGLHVVYEPEM